MTRLPKRFYIALCTTYSEAARGSDCGSLGWRISRRQDWCSGAAPERSSPLLDAHAEFHRVIGASRSREHYKPHIWIPHCTLATNVLPANAEAAKALSKEVFEPFEIDFALADCVEFPPLQIIDEVLLSP